MDSWTIAFKIPNLARRIFGEGAASSSLIPVYGEQLQKDRASADRLASTVVTVIFVILASAVLLGLAVIWVYCRFFCEYSSTKVMLTLTAIMLPYMVLVCVVAILGGVLNAHRHFAMPAAAPIVLNIFIIGSICFTGWVLKWQPQKQVFFVAVAVVTAGLVQVGIQIAPIRANGVRLRPVWEVNSEAFRKIIMLMEPMILGLTATQINTLSDDVIARYFSGSIEKGEFFSIFGAQIKYPMWEGSVSRLFYSQRLYQFPLGVLGISLATAIFPVMSANAAANDLNALGRTISRSFRGALFIALPAMIGLLLVGKPLISVIFEHGEFTAEDTNLTAGILYCYALGLCGYFFQQVVTRAFYSMQDSKMPARSAILAVFVNIVLNLVFMWFMGAKGLALSTAICSYLQVVILVVILKRRFGGSIFADLPVTFTKTLAGTAVMGLAGVFFLLLMRDLPEVFGFNLLRLAVIVPAAAAVYILTAIVLKTEMLSLFTGSRKGEKAV